MDFTQIINSLFQNNAENVIQEETQNNIINENNTNDDTTLNILNSTNEIKRNK